MENRMMLTCPLLNLKTLRAPPFKPKKISRVGQWEKVSGQGKARQGGGGGLFWVPPGNPIGNFGNLQNPTQMLSYNRMNNWRLHLANIDLSSAKISSVGSFHFFPSCPINSVYRKMERLEWMAWMRSAHETTHSIQKASVTWTPPAVIGKVFEHNQLRP